MTKRVYFLKIELLVLITLVCGTVGYTQDINQEYNSYFNELGVKNISDYQYVVFYPIHHSFDIDQHWIYYFLNAEQKFDPILFIVIIDEPNQLNILSEYARQRRNLIVDDKYYFQQYSFYSYYPFYCAIQKGKLINKVSINLYNAYGEKVKLYAKFMNR